LRYLGEKQSSEEGGIKIGRGWKSKKEEVEQWEKIEGRGERKWRSGGDREKVKEVGKQMREESDKKGRSQKERLGGGRIR